MNFNSNCYTIRAYNEYKKRYYRGIFLNLAKLKKKENKKIIMKLIKKKMTDVEITINNLVNEWVGLLKMSWSISIIKDSTQYKFRNRIEAGEFNSYGRIRNDLLNGNLISSFSVLNSLFVSSTDFIPYVMASQINPGRFYHLYHQTQTVGR